MKKRFTRMIAGVSSVAILTSFSNLAVPAFAAEVETEKERDYVASLEDENLQGVAQYFFDAGWSLDEVVSLVNRYSVGCQELEESKEIEAATPQTTSSDADYGNNGYFSQKPVSSYPHYLILITTNVNQHLNYYLRLKEDYDDVFGDEPAAGDVLSFNTDNAKSLSGYKEAIMSFRTNSSKTFVNATYTTESYPSTSAAWSSFMRIPLKIGSYANPTDGSESLVTETAFFNSISVRASSSSLAVDWDVIVYGDIDHDGRADEEDLAVLVNYLNNGTALCEKAGKTPWAYSFAYYAADADHDGVITSNDVYVYNQYLAGFVWPW